MKEGEHGYRIPAGCAIAGIFAADGSAVSGDKIMSMTGLMHERANGLGGGFAAYGIYPQYKDYYAFHTFIDDEMSRKAFEDELEKKYDIAQISVIPTRKNPKITDIPILMRYFVRPHRWQLEKTKLTADEFVKRTVIETNAQTNGVYIFSSGKNMGIFKGVGYPEDIGDFYRLEEYAAYSWTAHGRYPTNTPGWWGGAHPFGLLDTAVVHNGEISSYDANRRNIEMYGYKCSLMTDTEVITYMADFLTRVHALTYEETAQVLAAPFWSSIEALAKKDTRAAAVQSCLRKTYPGFLINGPFSILVSFTGGVMALNDRLKLRSMVTAQKGDIIYIASEEAAIRAVEPQAENLYHPRGGEPCIFRLKGGSADVCTDRL